jgi:uncharacterized protein
MIWRVSARFWSVIQICMATRMFSTTFRILETRDEHFYAHELFNYHWPLYGFDLPDAVLKKVYADNAREVFRQARRNAV